MAVSGRATHEQRAFFENAATQLIDVHGAKALYSVGPISFRIHPASTAWDRPARHLKVLAVTPVSL
jgi:hypothetical protein